ncbi:hypothetical protein BDV96DRAFT_4354 [Lophiotrema nucula]|uniref:Uncharacterized protein n=1 Tax=Lophiotrema nucula TaxID=690887 RepID=A0A6A5ZV47_9PLEO|nr:hypothetical protein BDV96DRAFT_4354 [Lophiotrema nucula]
MPLAPIEKLPAELIQPIFFYSDLNLALPAASPHIASKFANEYCYHAVCTRYLTTNLESRVEQTLAQTRIFSYKWMMWDHFRSFVLKKWGVNGCLCGKTPKEGCFDAQWPPDFEDATTMLFSRSHLPALSYIKCRIPVKLLSGPWTSDKVQFLRFLLWTTSMTVDWASHEARAAAREGKKEALLTGNLEVVELFNHNRRLGKAPSVDTVRFAVMDAGCDRSIVYDTMATARTWGLRGEAWNCEVLDQWCEGKIQEGDPKGEWLQLKLEELRVTHGAGDLNSGYMDPETGNYEDVDGDKLVITPHKWNQVYIYSCAARPFQDALHPVPSS